MVDSLDQQLDSFFTWLDKNIPGGLANVWIALSADHGVAPVPAQAASLGMPAANINLGKFTASLNDTMNAKFSPGEKVEYLLPQQELPYLALNRPSFEVAGINEQEAEQAIQQAVPAAVAAIAPPPAERAAPRAMESEASNGGAWSDRPDCCTSGSRIRAAARRSLQPGSNVIAGYSLTAGCGAIGRLQARVKTNRKLAVQIPKGKSGGQRGRSRGGSSL